MPCRATVKHWRRCNGARTSHYFSWPTRPLRCREASAREYIWFFEWVGARVYCAGYNLCLRLVGPAGRTSVSINKPSLTTAISDCLLILINVCLRVEDLVFSSSTNSAHFPPSLSDCGIFYAGARGGHSNVCSWLSTHIEMPCKFLASTTLITFLLFHSKRERGLF